MIAPDRIALYTCPNATVYRIMTLEAIRGIDPLAINFLMDLDRYSFFLLEIHGSVMREHSIISVRPKVTKKMDWIDRINDMGESVSTRIPRISNHPRFWKYWIPFLEDMVISPDFDLVGTEIFGTPAFVPDAFIERIQAMAPKEATLRALTKSSKEAEGVERYELLKDIDELWMGMVRDVFLDKYVISIGDLLFEITTDYVTGPHFWFDSDTHTWSIFDGCGVPLSEDSSTMFEAWESLKSQRAAPGYDILMESQRETWEDENLIPGEPCYDIRVFHALGVESPLLLQLDEFQRWVSSSRRIC